MNGPLDGENCIQTTEAKSCTRDHPYNTLAYRLVGWVQKIAIFADIQYCIYADIAGGWVQKCADVIYGWSPSSKVLTKHKYDGQVEISTGTTI